MQIIQNGTKTTVTINGKCFYFDGSVSIINNKIITEDKTINIEDLSDEKKIYVNITGNVEKISDIFSVEVNGDVTGNITSNNNTKINGNVKGDITSSNDTIVDGNIEGNIKSGNDTTVYKNCSGNIKSGNDTYVNSNIKK